MNENIQNQLTEMRTLIHEMGWEDFMMHLGCLMAEQADKTSGQQSSQLFAHSRFIHVLKSGWAECGKFKYDEDMINER